MKRFVWTIAKGKDSNMWLAFVERELNSMKGGHLVRVALFFLGPRFIQHEHLLLSLMKRCEFTWASRVLNDQLTSSGCWSYYGSKALIETFCLGLIGGRFLVTLMTPLKFLKNVVFAFFEVFSFVKTFQRVHHCHDFLDVSSHVFLSIMIVNTHV